MYAPLIPGIVIDRNVRLLEYIGSGAQSDIWIVEEFGPPRKGGTVGKVIACKYADRNERAVDRMRAGVKRDIEIANQIRSSYVMIPLYQCEDNVTRDDYPELEDDFVVFCFVMHRATYGSVKDVLEEDNKRFQGQNYETVELMRRIAEGIRDIHTEKIVHCDLKPANILAHRQKGSPIILPMIADFGTAYRVNNPEDISFVGMTRRYSAPERLGEQGEVPELSSDIFSLGLIFFEMLTGTHLYDVVSNTSVSDNNITRQFVIDAVSKIDVSAFSKSFHVPQIGTLICNMLSPTPSKRPVATTIMDTLHDAVEKIRKIETEIRNASSPLFPRRYLWDDRVHTTLGSKLYYYLLPASQPERDAVRLYETLKSHKIYSYSLYRVLGAYDFVIRIWSSAELIERLDKILDSYCDEFDRGQPIKLDVGEIEHGRKLRRRLDWAGLDSMQLIKHIADIAERSFEVAGLEPVKIHPESVGQNMGGLGAEAYANRTNADVASVQYELLRSEGLVLGLLRPKSLSPTETQFYILMQSNKDLDEHAKAVYSRVIVEFFKNVQSPEKTAERISKYEHKIPKTIKTDQLMVHNMRDPRNFLISFKLNHFYLFKIVFLELLQEISDVSTAFGGRFTFNTLIDLDSNGFALSDDGSILSRVGT